MMSGAIEIVDARVRVQAEDRIRTDCSDDIVGNRRRRAKAAGFARLRRIANECCVGYDQIVVALLEIKRFQRQATAITDLGTTVAALDIDGLE